MKEALTALLLDHAPLAGLVGARVTWDFTDPGHEARPYIVLTAVDDREVEHYRGVSDLQVAEVQVDTYADSPASREAVRRVLRSLLAGARMDRDGIAFRRIAILRSRGGSESIPGQGGDALRLYRNSLDIEVHWKESTP